MDPQTVAALVQLGVAGVFLYAFLSDKLRTKAATDEAMAEMRRLYDARIDEQDRRYLELREDRDTWKGLTLGTERRLDRVAPAVATGAVVPVPSAVPPPLEAPGA